MALIFDATTKYVSVADSATLNISAGSFTVCTWFYRTPTTVRAGLASHTETGTATTGWWFDVRATSDTGKVQFTVNDTDYFSAGNNCPTVSTWYHVAAAYDATANELRFFVNATDVSPGTVAKPGTVMSDPAASLFVGRDNNAYSDDTTHGGIQDFRIYNVALSAANLASIQDGSAYGSPVIWLDNFTTGSTVTDQSGNGLDGTVTGSPTTTTDPAGWSAYSPGSATIPIMMNHRRNQGFS